VTDFATVMHAAYDTMRAAEAARVAYSNALEAYDSAYSSRNWVSTVKES
jgi:hypothetical protein